MPSEEQVNSINEASESVSTYIETYGTRIIVSILLFFILTRLIRLITKVLRGFLEKRNFEQKVVEISVNATKFTLNLFLIIFLAAFIGIEISNIVLVLIGLILLIAVAMKDTLANIGAGFIMFSLKLFKKGDYLEFEAMEGKVKNIDIYHTAIVRPDNAVVLIPNSNLLSSIVVNTDKERKRRVDIVIYVSFKNDIDKIKQELMGTFKGDERILDDPVPFFNVIELTNVSVAVRLSIWVKKEDYWDVLFEYNEKAIKALQKIGVKFPISGPGRKNSIK